MKLKMEAVKGLAEKEASHYMTNDQILTLKNSAMHLNDCAGPNWEYCSKERVRITDVSGISYYAHAVKTFTNSEVESVTDLEELDWGSKTFTIY